MQTPVEAAQLLLQAYARAVLDKDVQAFISLYHPDACIFDTWGVWSYSDAQAWAGMAREWFAALPATECVVVTWDELQARQFGDALSVLAFLTYTAMTDKGEKIRAMTNRLSWVVQRDDDGLKIVHEHTSAPADHESGKLILQR
ncbi:YybH family protein [Uliginosibacterium sp. H1]|uniref:YybH family protein n=1 Tax=Uliginosibacterium sp. H1 TaxID=3114757 RepID=UPI002E19CED5|nr:nuclear transport factor 2 family protein [Uliginosibacterium sp. H1]